MTYYEFVNCLNDFVNEKDTTLIFDKLNSVEFTSYSQRYIRAINQLIKFIQKRLNKKVNEIIYNLSIINSLNDFKSFFNSYAEEVEFATKLLECNFINKDDYSNITNIIISINNNIIDEISNYFMYNIDIKNYLKNFYILENIEEKNKEEE